MLLELGGSPGCDRSKDPCCDNGVPARGAGGVEGCSESGSCGVG